MELLLGGVRVEVGFVMLKLHRALLVKGRVEPTMLGVLGSSPGVQHVVSSGGTLTLTEPLAPRPNFGGEETAGLEVDDPVRDFDALR